MDYTDHLLWARHFKDTVNNSYTCLIYLLFFIPTGQTWCLRLREAK